MRESHDAFSSPGGTLFPRLAHNLGDRRYTVRLRSVRQPEATEREAGGSRIRDLGQLLKALIHRARLLVQISQETRVNRLVGDVLRDNARQCLPTPSSPVESHLTPHHPARERVPR